MEIMHDQALGKVGTIDIKLEKSKLVIDTKIKVEVAGLETGLVVSVDSVVVLDAIAKAIPGQVDDSVIAVMKMALAAL